MKKSEDTKKNPKTKAIDTNKKNEISKKKQDQEIDRNSKDSFPASDPPPTDPGTH